MSSSRGSLSFRTQTNTDAKGPNDNYNNTMFGESKILPGNANVQYNQYPVTTQPVFQQTTVIMNQPQTMNQWSSGICGCFEDMKSCCFANFCGNCYYACISARMGESCCVGLGCVPGGHLAMRSAFRNKHGIAGDICGDCCAVTYCLPCVMCQLSREMDNLAYPQGTC